MSIEEADKYLTPEEIREKNRRRHYALRRQGRAQAYQQGVKTALLGGGNPLAKPELLITARPRKG